MKSQKKSNLKYCIKCGIILTDENWLKYLQLPKRSNYTCTPCFRQYGKTHYKIDPDYNKKQAARYNFRKSAVIFSYGNVCIQCQEDDYDKLTIDYINGNSKQHRKKLHNNIYEWLYNNPINKNVYQVLCYNCNYNKNTIYKDKYALRDKNKVINNYGGYCVECKEDKIELLTINYNNELVKLKCLKQKSGIIFYRWLIKNEYPLDLGIQIICFNCYHSKKSMIKNLKKLEFNRI